MNIALWGWTGLVIALCLTTFGTSICSVAIIAILLFILGILTHMYLIQEDNFKDYIIYETDDLLSDVYKMGEEMKKPKSDLKIDKRFTGSHVIDDQLQEIIYFIMRDYIYPWYDQVSDSDDFANQLKMAVSKIIVSFSNRMKEVDWTVYLTTTLVDAAATHVRLYRQAKSQTGNLEDAFFDLELQMERNSVCRDHVSTQPSQQRCFLQDLTEVVLFLLAPELEFHCLPVRLITREVIVNVVLIPLVQKLSDPDYINRLIIWLCRDFQITSDVFLNVLRITDNLDELSATKELLNKEILSLRCRDGGGESEAWIKQQLSSLMYVEKVVDIQTNRLQDGADCSGPNVDYYKIIGGHTKLFQLPLDVIIKNNIALSYFMDYMTTIGQQNYLFLYLNIEGWKVSTEQELGESCTDRAESSLLAEQYSQTKQAHDRVREAASSIFEHYLADKGASRVKMDENVIRRLLNRIRTEKPNDNWFDDVQSLAFEKMQEDVGGFRAWSGYIRLLAELDLLREGSRSDEDDNRSLDELSLGSDSQSLTDYSHLIGEQTGGSLESDLESSGSPVHSGGDSRPLGPFTLMAEIIETGIVQEKGKTFGIYALSVTKKYENGHKESWHIYRRYSDFYELYQKIKEKFGELSKVNFPGKKTFHNMERRTLERRMIGLNTWLNAMTRPALLAAKPGLLPLLLMFLHPGDYDNKPHSHFARTLNSLFRVSMQAVRTVPGSVLNSVDDVVDGLTRVLQVRTAKDIPQNPPLSNRVGASLDTETGDNIPLRILLLLMTEVFELKASNQWLRRRIVTILRQILRTMFGDIVNKRIVDYVSLMTSPQQVSNYLKTFKDAFWPNGIRAEPSAPRDHNTKMRTRVGAKVSLLSSLSDELKRILGSETSRYGMLNVFSLLQVEALNTRLIFVLLEGILTTLFGVPAMEPVFTKLHSKSERLHRAQSQSQSPDATKPVN